jgi:predicted ester cyclase
MKRTIALNRAAFPDVQLTVDDQIAEGDKVVTRWHCEMTHLGTLGSLPATGKRVTITGITIDRFEGGKIVEAWRSMDVLGLRLTIGVIEDKAVSG